MPARMKRVRALLLTASLTGGAQPVFACHHPCPVPSIESAFKESSDVFYGEVIDRVPRSLEARIAFKLIKRWKGGGASKVTLTAASNTCDELGLEAVPGAKFIVFARPKLYAGEKDDAATALVTGHCHGSVEIKRKDKESAYLKILDKLSKRGGG